MTYVLLGILLGVFTLLNILAPVSGSATVTPLLTGLVGPKDAIAIATVFFFLTCLPRIYLFRDHIRWDLVRQLWPISIVGAVLGGILLSSIPEQMVLIVVLGFLCWFIYQKLLDMKQRNAEKLKTTTRGASFIGFFSGALQGSGLAGADLRNGYLLSKGLTLPQIHGTTPIIGGSNFLLSSVYRLHTGDLSMAMAWPVLALFPVIIMATIIGRHISLRLSKQWQDRSALLVMFVALVSIGISIVR